MSGNIFIVKRDGNVESFAVDKIKNAISRSFLSVGSFATQEILSDILGRLKPVMGTMDLYSFVVNEVASNAYKNVPWLWYDSNTYVRRPRVEALCRFMLKRGYPNKRFAFLYSHLFLYWLNRGREMYLIPRKYQDGGQIPTYVEVPWDVAFADWLRKMGVSQFEYSFMEKVKPYIQNFSTLNPIIGLLNTGMMFKDDTDLYGNPVTNIDKAFSLIGNVFFPLSQFSKSGTIFNTVSSTLDDMSSGYTIFNTFVGNTDE